MPTVGELRQAIEGLPDDAEVRPDWFYGAPSDADPAVEIHGFARTTARCVDGSGDYLTVRVSLAYLDDLEAEDVTDICLECDGWGLVGEPGSESLCDACGGEWATIPAGRASDGVAQ